ncbi:C-C motif chemokine 3-like [Lepisosteus oculatus]|uniref:C-C motif chemokine 3-like n=1 Tax=Lepisosteus oculatus TaxID=7918 RepID=UPI0035F522E0
MKSTVLVIQVLLLAALCSVLLCENSHQPDECCFAFYPKRLPFQALASYKKTNSKCTKDAAIFTTKKGREICADAELHWVKKYIQLIDLLKKSVEEGSGY